MEVALPGPLALDCEDMFKEITKKLYGDEGALEFPDRIDQDEGSLLKPEDHITAFGLAALMQNGFPPPGILHANFQPKTNPAAEDKWSASDEALQWTNSRIASYNPAQKLFKCVDCECVGFLSRVAEHWLGTHSNARVFQCPQCAYGSAWARCVRLHLVREHGLPDDRGTDSLVKNNPVLDEVTKYLQRLKAKVDGACPAPGARGPGGAGGGGGAAGRGRAASPPLAPPGAAANKRYGCPACPYATDRRDLFTRHENIHRDEKPFECYVCQKQFNRADHVKKHFLRMHRDHPYDLNRIRRQIPKSPPNGYYPKQGVDRMAQGDVPGGDQSYSTRPPPGKQDCDAHRIKSERDQSAAAKGATSKKKGEKRYSCCYCTWSGVDNWCLKRHLNTHLKPFVCALCDYKAARSERLATHVAKVHNKKACGKCSFLAEDQTQLSVHLQEQHHVENRNIKVPNTMLRPGYGGGPSAPAMSTFGSPDGGNGSGGGVAAMRTWRPPRQQGAARLFNYMEASDGSDQDDFEGKGYPTDERSVQDFPEAGDVGNEDVGVVDAAAAPAPIVTSPAVLAERTVAKKRTPKRKKTGDKENERSGPRRRARPLRFEAAGAFAERDRGPAGAAARSPLSASNGDRRRFDFDLRPDGALPAGPIDDVDENGERTRKSRKQRRPKRVLQAWRPEKKEPAEPTSVPSKAPPPAEARPVAERPPGETRIDRIISKIIERKDMRTDDCASPTANEGVSNPPEKKKINLNAVMRRIRSKLSRCKDNKYSKCDTKTLKKRVIFKCKSCNLKFRPNREFYLHFRYCKRNGSDQESRIRTFS